MKNHVSIITVNYNTPEDTKATIQSLADIAHNGFDYRVIVVDNGSKEPLSFNKVFLKNNPKVDLLRSESNLGFSGGNNLGIQHAIDHYDSDYYLLLNSDTIVTKDFLQELVKMMKSDPRIGLAASKVYFHRGYEYFENSYTEAEKHHVLWYVGGRIDWTNLLSYHIGIDEVDRGHFNNETETDYATGCVMMISREVIERVGRLDDRFFLYSEDVDFSLRVREAGLKVMYCPSSVIYHKIGRSTGGAGSPLQQYYQTRNRLFLTFRHAPMRSKLTALHLIFDILRRGNKSERKAILDLVLGRMGKQAFI
ncbi:MAG: Glycosyltransferase [Candidatus Pacebacteria bacterium GW2011_GWF2_38_9]|nr:MAG: glycosyltransferase [candidate division TM6 bacterium GW2011_GWF2_28_16]KKQ10208.1 MAG: Glycosyltransferase [Candidatus Pacebacteria bacterium GW2011_GWF1_36_5]KKQ88832.1 MAG: Glycosyltransferase [Candidatus Pacebacteria bacterium GW2011_GWF2_38_9]HAZ73229.1 glycosyltransferase family 2 protein [Candidatus Paceibacterota bacterium]